MLVTLFRITCLSLALFFVLDMFFFSGSKVFVETGFGKQLRFFTLWSLIANFFALIFLTLSSSFKIFDRAAPFIAISALMGFFTIVLYWGLFFIDPTLVNYAGERLNFSREIYLHFAGPALLFFDAFILKKAFTDFYRITAFAFFINFASTSISNIDIFFLLNSISLINRAPVANSAAMPCAAQKIDLNGF